MCAALYDTLTAKSIGVLYTFSATKILNSHTHIRPAYMEESCPWQEGYPRLHTEPSFTGLLYEKHLIVPADRVKFDRA